LIDGTQLLLRRLTSD